MYIDDNYLYSKYVSNDFLTTLNTKSEDKILSKKNNDFLSTNKFINSLLPLSEIQFYILLVLYKKNCYGYGIYSEIREITDNRIIIQPPVIYKNIERFITKGIISEDEFIDSLDDKRYFRITNEGRRLLLLQIERLKKQITITENYL